MIVTCPQCKKNFKIQDELIPDKGRQLQCGSCDHIWFYINKNQTTDPLSFNLDVSLNESQTNIIDDITNKTPEINNKDSLRKIKNKDDENINNEIEENQQKGFKKKEKKTIINFFSYLIVFIISFVALIILLDTLKTPIINVFPEFEMILFNLFETLKDIKLFIIDLS